MVNLLQPDRITAEIASLRPQVDLLIVGLHFGVEFRFRPTLNQRRLVQSLLEAGSDVILGAHPHVLQPIVTPRIPTGSGSYRQTVAAYSLGNFTSARMLGIRQSQCGAILLITAEKDESQQAVVITAISAVPTYCQRIAGKGQSRFRVIPLRGYLRNPDRHLPLPLRRKLQQSWNRVVGILGRRYVHGVK
jgi:poly-gamma-glutamate synthesis protein (capsule biosynthesis protein)